MHYVRRVLLPLLLVAVIVTAGSPAWAQPPAPAKPAEVGMGDYLIPMAVVLLGLVLGFIMVLKPSNRRDRAKPVQYEVKAEKEGH